jgi:hypothetical protein
MNLSSRFSLFGLLPIAIFAVSCAQPGTAPTSPSSVGPSATAAGPSADYNASGTWSFVFTDVHGGFDGDFESEVHQDPVTGNLTFFDNDHFLVTLERLSNGEGAIITYRQADIETGSRGCDFRVMGTARLDTTTNTLTMPYRLKELECGNGRQGGLLIGTKIS